MRDVIEFLGLSGADVNVYFISDTLEKRVQVAYSGKGKQDLVDLWVNGCRNVKRGVNRYVFSVQTLSNELDERKTKQALIPNVIHTTDAIFARRLAEKFNCFVVYDEFLLSSNIFCLSIDYANEIFWEARGGRRINKSYSIFILF